MIFPINSHLQVQPLKRDGVMATHDKNFDEKGLVIKGFEEVENGMTVYFDSWQAAKFNEDTDEEFWLIPYSAIRAYEQ